MKNQQHESKKIVEMLLLYLATLSMVIIIILNFVFFGPPADALRLMLPSILASLVAVLLIYILRRVLFRSTDRFLGRSEIDSLSVQIAQELRRQEPYSKGVVFYEKWSEVPWKDILREAKEIEFYASYMGSWITQAKDELQRVFNRGGRIRAFLPEPGSDAANRIIERMPEYKGKPDEITEKIKDTVYKLETMRKKSNNKDAKLEVHCTTVFCMHCLISVNKKRLVLAPFEHFRQWGEIGNPTFIINLEEYPRLADWAARELNGFERSGKIYQAQIPGE